MKRITLVFLLLVASPLFAIDMTMRLTPPTGSLMQTNNLPESRPGCFLALYGEDYQFNTGGIAIWPDRSGKGNSPTQSTEANKPAKKTSADGCVCASFAATLQYLNKAYPNTTLSGKAPFTCFLVLKTGNRGATQYTTMFSLGSTVNSSRGFSFSRYNATRLFHSAAGITTLSASDFPSTRIVAMLGYTGTNVVYSENGQTIYNAVNNSLNFIINLLSINTEYGYLGNYWGDNEIYSIICYERYLSAHEQNQIVNWLKSKYKIP